MPPFNASFIAIGVLCFAPIALAPTILVQTSLAQTSQPRRATPAPGRGASGRPAASPPTQDPPFDVHDLSGFWRGGGIRYGQGMRFSLGTPAPPMTAWAQARYDAAIPGIGAGGNKPDNPRAKPLGNDPIMICDPVGYPRIILTAGNHGIQIVQKPKEMIWLFAWFYARRIQDSRPSIAVIDEVFGNSIRLNPAIRPAYSTCHSDRLFEKVLRGSSGAFFPDTVMSSV